jgi:hypothetical protein
MSQTLTRLLPPIAVQQQTIVANGRTYSSTPGHVVDVLDFDATVLTANGWLRVAQSGTTAQRPDEFPRERFLRRARHAFLRYDRRRVAHLRRRCIAIAHGWRVTLT